ncbi:MAG: glycosyltransferase [Planctomycetota bacterium]
MRALQAGSERGRPLAVTFLLEDATEPWGGVQTLLRDSRALAARGHHVVGPNGIQAELFRPGDRSHAPPFRVGLVGPWERSWADTGKDIPTGIRAFRSVHESGLDVQLVRISAQPISADERDAWDGLPVEWHEKGSIEEMAELYRSLDLFLGTSRAEGFFLPAIEAMASGVPCILTDIPCFRNYDEIQDYALFAPPGHSGAIAERMIELLEDPDRMSAPRRRGLEVASHYTFERHVDALERALQSLVPPGSSLVERKGAKHALEWNDEWSSYEENVRHSLLYQILDALAWAWNTQDVPWARELASSATRIYSDPPDLWQSLGRIHVHERNWDEAERAFLEAVALCPESPAIHDSLGRVRCEQLRYPDAVRHFEAAIRFGMPGDGIRVDLAKALWNAGAFHEAERVLREAIRVYPDSVEAARLARCFTDGVTQGAGGLLVRGS